MSRSLAIVALAALLASACSCETNVGLDASAGADGDVGEGGTSDAEVDGGGLEAGSPVFVTEPPTTVAEGDTYLYGALAEDPDGEIITYSLVVGPPGMEIGASTGSVFWPVPQDAAGTHELAIRASDPSGHTADQRATITVTRVNVAPRIVTRPPTDGARTYEARAEDEDDDSLTWSLESASAGLTLEGSTVRASSATPAVLTATLRVSDPDGASDTQDIAFGFGSGDSTPPAVALSAPAAGFVVRAPVDVVGSASDPAIVQWILEACQPVSATRCSELSRGTGAVSGTLSSLHPGPFLDEPLRLRLRAWDADGNEGSAQRDVVVESENHPGLFGIEIVDMITRVDGQRVELVRAYDSRRVSEGDFGVGWELRSNVEEGVALDPTFSVSNPLARGWRIIFDIFSPDIEPTTTHTIQLEVPGDGIYVFEFAPRVTSLSTGAAFVVPEYDAPFGATITAILESGAPYRPGDTLVATNSGSDAPITFLDLTPYAPPAFRVTTPGGASFDLAADGELLRSTGWSPTSGGDGVYLLEDGIYGSRGRAVAIDRTAAGRITAIRDLRYPLQTAYTYADDATLTQVDHPRSLVSRYTYEDLRLTRYELPDGYGATRLEFDDLGRVARRFFPEGRILVYAYDDAARRVTVRDGAGGVLVTEHDPLGRVQATTDALGHRTELEHDAAGRVTLERDPEGRETRYAYDAMGQLIRAEEAGRGPFIARFSGDAPAGFTDRDGRSWDVSASGDTTRLLGPGGVEAIQLTVDPEGRLTEERVAGATTRYGYDADGRVDHIEEPSGFVYDIVRSADGLRSDITTEDGETLRRVEEPSGDVAEVGAGPDSIQYDYDFGGTLREIASPFGTTRFEVDPGGNPTRTLRDGEVVEERQYDGAGRLVLTRDADGWFHRRRYDAAGRVFSEQTPEGTATYALDEGGALVDRMDFDGTMTHFERDEHGRVTRLASSQGDDYAFEYDERGRIRAARAAGRGFAEHTYDPVSGLIASIRGPGGTERYTYDMRFAELGDDGLTAPVATREERGGGTWTYRRDAAGRIVETAHSAASTPTLFRYAGDGTQIDRVTDANGQEWSFTWDDSYLVETRTPEGHVTTYSSEPDGTAVVVRPDASTERRSLDDDGNFVRRFDAGLELSVRLDTSEDGERVLSSRSPDAELTYEYGSAGQLTGIVSADGASATLEHDARGRVVAIEVRAPDGTMGRSGYEYGADGLVDAMIDPAGGRTEYRWENGRLVGIERPNGTATVLSLGECARPERITHTDPSGATLLEETFEYGAGCRLVAQEGPEGRTEFRYDGQGRVVESRSPAAAGGVTTHRYDEVGNRVETTTPSGTTTRTYDRDGRVTRSVGPEGTITFEYDARGNLVAERGHAGGDRTYEYDAADHLVSTTRGGAGERMRYDAEGRLVAMGVEGTRRCLPAPAILGFGSGCLAFYGADAPTTFVLHGPDGVAGDVTGSTARHVHAGHQGSVVLMTDPSGAALGRASYGASGEALSDSLPADFPYRWNGELRVAGLTYLRARWLAPHLGAFTTPDMARADAEDPRSLHRYLYALGDPLNRIDPEGTFSIAGISVSISISGNLRSMRGAAMQAARCRIQARLRNLVAQQIIRTVFGGFLRRLETVLLNRVQGMWREGWLDQLLRNQVFCRGTAASSVGGQPFGWTTSLGGDGQPYFQVNVDSCGRGNRLQTGGGIYPGTWDTCSQRRGTLPSGTPGIALTSGIDFVVGARLVDRNSPRGPRIVGGVPIELKRDLASRPWSSSQQRQLVRYCRYASHSQSRLIFYVWGNQLPDGVTYARRAVDCLRAWSGSTCGNRRPIGGILIYTGQDRSGGTRRLRVYYPRVSGLC